MGSFLLFFRSHLDLAIGSMAKQLRRPTKALGFKMSRALLLIISLILPVQKEAQAMDLITEHKLYCNRLTRVIPAPGKSTKRVLLECSYSPGKAIEDDLTIETETRHMYSDKFKKLVDEFYLSQH